MNFQPSITVMVNGNICLDVPIEIKHKSGRKLIIAPEVIDGANTEAESPVQSALILALARAHAWMAAFESGEFKNVRQLSTKLNLDFSYVCQLLRLLNLAPDIQEAIIRGEEPDGLSVTRLRKPMPDDWREQRELFGIGIGNGRRQRRNGCS